MTLTPQDLDELRAAKKILEKPSFVARVSNAVGAPLEKSFTALPRPVTRVVGDLTETVVGKAFDSALYTLRDPRAEAPSNLTHKLAAMASGAVGGAFGIGALALELPVSTTIMLRSIADIARSEGEDLAHPESRLACLEVFAMGGAADEDDAAESGYFAVRAALARAVSEAAKYVAERSVVEEGAPVIARLLAKIAARFNAVVGEKIMAQGVPLIGALGGATINLLFIDHFQDMARGHFTVRRLERVYGDAAVAAKYREILRLRA